MSYSSLFTKYKNTICKNSNFKMVIVQVPIKDDPDGKTTDTMELQNFGCGNDRRNGSAYCQECSDAYKRGESGVAKETVDMPKVLDIPGEAPSEQSALQEEPMA